jgi:hypothetical protein
LELENELLRILVVPTILQGMLDAVLWDVELWVQSGLLHVLLPSEHLQVSDQDNVLEESLQEDEQVLEEKSEGFPETVEGNEESQEKTSGSFEKPKKTLVEENEKLFEKNE